MREITFQQALIEAMREEMLRDERVFLMGEDVGLYGGAYGASKGLFDEFGPERIRDTAISEAAIVGAGAGAALTGMRPIAEIMYIDCQSGGQGSLYVRRQGQGAAGDTYQLRQRTFLCCSALSVPGGLVYACAGALRSHAFKSI